MSIRTTLAICTVFALAACTDNATSTSPMLSADRSPELSRNDGGNPTGDVYVMTNAAESNVVLAFHRAANGSLKDRRRSPPAAGEVAGLGWDRRAPSF